MQRNQITQEIPVFRRVSRHEWRAKTGGECGLWLTHSFFGAGDFGGIAGQEVIHSLRGIELRYGRQDPEGVASQHDDVSWMDGPS